MNSNNNMILINILEFNESMNQFAFEYFLMIFKFLFQYFKNE